MKCPACHNIMVCSLGEHHYRESGLENVYLKGIEICTCDCGEKTVAFPAINELHKKIALLLIRKKSLLKGQEIRFLRKNMGLTAKKLSGIMGVDNATISRWEKGKQAISDGHDRCLRLVYANIKGTSEEEIRHLINEDFNQITTEREASPDFMISVEDYLRTKIDLPRSF